LNDDNSSIEQLVDCRKSIDNLDAALIAILAERFRLTEKIGRTKVKGGFEARDLEREQRQLKRFRKLASSHKLDVDVAVDIMIRIIHHVKKRHKVLEVVAGPRAVGRSASISLTARSTGRTRPVPPRVTAKR
jgi:chorismate mutase